MNSDRVNKEGEDKILEISDVLIKFYKSNLFFTKAMRIRVGGHTDRIGGDTINFPLSYRRASNISNLITTQFLSKSSDVEIIPIAYGSKYPLPGHNSEWEPRNRRITIVIEFISTELLSGLNN